MKHLIALLVVGGVLFGCSAKARDQSGEQVDAGQLPSECDDFLAVYRACLGDQHRNVGAVEQHIATTREALLRTSDVTALKVRCASSATRLRTACR